MNRNNNANRPNNPNNNNGGGERGWNGWAIAGAVVGTVAAVAGGAYLLSRKKPEQPSTNQSQNTRGLTQTTQVNSNKSQNRTERVPSSTDSSENEEPNNQVSNYVSGLLNRMNTPNTSGQCRRGVPKSSVPKDPVLSNIDSLLHDLYLRYIAINDDDFENYYKVVDHIFLQLHRTMKEIDPYYKKYSSQVQFAGSHPDRLRINKPDEFDIDIAIGLPLSTKINPLNPKDSDFIFEPKDPGFTQLKVGVQFERLPFRDGEEWLKNKAAFEWKDDKNYLLRSKFSDWFKSVVNRALNEFVENSSLPPIFYVNGVPYTVRRSESGPAMTIFIENHSRNFKLDVDLVPALRFPIERWPINCSYRSIPSVCAGKDYWMVVPKPNKAGHTEQDRSRSWRVAMHEQEAMLMYNVNHMKQAIRYIKKLRDAKNMNKIASYYIKTMFFWEAAKHQKDPAFWNQAPVVLFKLMLKNFHDYLVAGNLPYFWNKNNNLIGQLNRATLDRYATIVSEVLGILDEPSQYKQIAKYLLTDSEFREYNEAFLHI